MEILYCPDKKRYHEAVDNSLAASNLLPVGLLQVKLL